MCSFPPLYRSQFLSDSLSKELSHLIPQLPRSTLKVYQLATHFDSTATRPVARLETMTGTNSSNLKAEGSPLAFALCNLVENVVNALEPPLPRMSDPSVHLARNLFPLMDESPPQKCLEVFGTIPDCLNGVYLRNGPNLLHMPRAGYHEFDGDGMIHAVKISNGEAIHCCRFTKTNRFVQEKAAGQPLFTKPLGELNGISGVAKLLLLSLRHTLGVIDTNNGIGPANAGLAFFEGRLLAMSEDDMPYEIRVNEDGDLQTVGRFNFSGALQNAMTAHPKIDPVTGEMFAFSYNLLQRPYLKFFRVTKQGKKEKDVPITLTEPTLVHDFAITENYVVFCEHQMVFRLQEMFIGRSPVVCDANKVPRFGIMPRYANHEGGMKWFESAASTCFHFLNAWEEGEEVVLLGTRQAPVEIIFANPERLDCRVMEFRFNLRTGEVRKEQVCSANIDVGRVNEKRLGRKTRYAYLCTSGLWPNYSGVAKVDLEAPRVVPMASEPGVSTGEPCIAGWRNFGEGTYGSEPFFVPGRSGGSGSAAIGDDCAEEEEDDGYVLAFVHDSRRGCSELLIMDARSQTLETVAAIKLPTRVPNGFHGLFVSDEQLKQQRQ